jgi:hypothetical protein
MAANVKIDGVDEIPEVSLVDVETLEALMFTHLGESVE